MAAKKRKKRKSSGSVLRHRVRAAWFVAQCFGIGEKELNAATNNLRKTDVNPTENLPQVIWREDIKRARHGKGYWRELVEPLCQRALADRTQWLNGKPLWAFAATMTERMVSLLLRLYERVWPRLDKRCVRKADALWLLVENVFVPTVFNVLVREWRRGLGSEFEGQRCWYLPAKSKGKVVGPVARVLGCWLRVSGYRTAYGVSTVMGENWRRNLERWLQGKPVPSVTNLHTLVDQFGADVRWLEETSEWKARFILACGMQNLCDAMDVHFKRKHKGTSRMIAVMFRRLSRERIASNDDDGVLADEGVFFSGRLLQLRLRREGKWETEVLAHLPSGDRTFGDRVFGPEATKEGIEDYHRKVDDEIEANRRKMDWESKSGNWVMGWVKGEIQREQGAGTIPSTCEGIREQVFELGVLELNRLLDERAGG